MTAGHSDVWQSQIRLTLTAEPLPEYKQCFLWIHVVEASGPVTRQCVVQLYLNAWSPVGGTVCEELGMASLGKICPWGQVLSFQKSTAFPVSSQPCGCPSYSPSTLPACCHAPYHMVVVSSHWSLVTRNNGWKDIRLCSLLFWDRVSYNSS